MTSSPSLNPQEIRQILDALEQSDWDEAVVTVGDVSIALARNGAPLPGSGVTAVSAPRPAPAEPAAAIPTAAPAPVPPAPAAPAPAPSPVSAGADVEVTSPTVGIFWRSPEPGAPPFAEVGARVEAGDILCIVEVMKLMNNVTAPVSGVVTGIRVDNAAAVEFDEVLLTIAPEGS